MHVYMRIHYCIITDRNLFKFLGPVKNQHRSAGCQVTGTKVCVYYDRILDVVVCQPNVARRGKLFFSKSEIWNSELLIKSKRTFFTCYDRRSIIYICFNIYIYNIYSIIHISYNACAGRRVYVLISSIPAGILLTYNITYICCCKNIPYVQRHDRLMNHIISHQIFNEKKSLSKGLTF